jgi:hypothetical protein
MALPLAVLGLVVIAALVAAGFAGAVLEQRIGRNLLYAVQAAGAAEVGAAQVVGEWDAHGLGLLAVGESALLPSVALYSGTTYTPTVTRLNHELWETRVEGIRNDDGGSPLARRELSLILQRVDSGPLPVRPLPNRAWSRVSP